MTYAAMADKANDKTQKRNKKFIVLLLAAIVEERLALSDLNF